MKISFVKTISCILIGVVISEAISLFLFDKIPYHIGYYLPIAIGTFLSGYIAGYKGWIIGLSVGALNFLIIQVILSVLTIPFLGKPSLPPFDISLLTLFVIVGAVFGALGEWTKKRYIAFKRNKRDKETSTM